MKIGIRMMGLHCLDGDELNGWGEREREESRRRALYRSPPPPPPPPVVSENCMNAWINVSLR
jgi:hypothetical protein